MTREVKNILGLLLVFVMITGVALLSAYLFFLILNL